MVYQVDGEPLEAGYRCPSLSLQTQTIHRNSIHRLLEEVAIRRAGHRLFTTTVDDGLRISLSKGIEMVEGRRIHLGILFTVDNTCESMCTRNTKGLESVTGTCTINEIDKIFVDRLAVMTLNLIFDLVYCPNMVSPCMSVDYRLDLIRRILDKKPHCMSF